MAIDEITNAVNFYDDSFHYDFDRSIEQLTILLTKMGEAHSLHNNTAHLAYITNKYAEA